MRLDQTVCPANRTTRTACLSQTLLTTALVFGGSAGAYAMDNYIVGPRALGMGGTGVASTNDQTAQFYNPALFGFFGRTTGPDNQDLAKKDWGFGIDVSAGARMHGELPELIETLGELDIQRLRATGITNSTDLRTVVRAAGALNDILKEGTAVSADGTAGVSEQTDAGQAGLAYRCRCRVGNVQQRNLHCSLDDRRHLVHGVGTQHDEIRAGSLKRLCAVGEHGAG